MADQQILIQYLYHSGFMVETPKHILIFDYYKGPVDFGNKPIIVFCSHSHADHFDPIIFEWAKHNSDICYVLSSDIGCPRNIGQCVNLCPDSTASIGQTEVTAFGSSDEGVSFLVSCDNKVFFHAGDLNWWHWWGENKEEQALAEKLFKAEIAKLKGHTIDVAFFPVDPRLEHYSHLGADYFIKELAPEILIPMHFAEASADVLAFAAARADCPAKIIVLTETNRTVLLF